MARSVRISEGAARFFTRIHTGLIPYHDSDGPLLRKYNGELVAALMRLDRASTEARPKRKRGAWTPAFRKAQQAQSRPSAAEKRERRAAIREKVAKRAEDAGGWCECGCGEQVWAVSDLPEARGEMDHFWGRGKGREPESVESCWFLRPACHLAKTRNQPDAATWARRFMDHCRGHGYAKMADKAHDRMMCAETRSSLPASPGTK